MAPLRRFVVVAALLVCAIAPARAHAWGASGHRYIARAAVETLPPEIPAFLRTPAAVAQIGELAREPDRWKGAGAPHDQDLDSGHFIDLTDDGHVYTAAGPLVSALPRTHADLDAALATLGVDPGKAGWLPYNIEDGYQGLVKDFAYWRILTAIIPRESNADTRAWYVADLKLREALIVRDLGVWAHYVGDASQPMHVSLHYNGWGAFPNPKNHTQDRIHAPFEGEYVRANVTERAVAAAITPYADCGSSIQVCTSSYLAATLARVEPLYALWTAGGFRQGDPRGRAFALERVAAGAQMLRDLVVKAWRASDEASIGRPPIWARDVERGRTPVRFEDLYGDD